MIRFYTAHIQSVLTYEIIVILVLLTRMMKGTIGPHWKERSSITWVISTTSRWLTRQIQSSLTPPSHSAFNTLPSCRHTSFFHTAVSWNNVEDLLYVRCWAGCLYCTSHTQLQVVSKEQGAVTLRVGGYGAGSNRTLLIYACLLKKHTTSWVDGKYTLYSSFGNKSKNMIGGSHRSVSLASRGNLDYTGSVL